MTQGAHLTFDIHAITILVQYVIITLRYRRPDIDASQLSSAEEIILQPVNDIIVFAFHQYSLLDDPLGLAREI